MNESVDITWLSDSPFRMCVDSSVLLSCSVFKHSWRSFASTSVSPCTHTHDGWDTRLGTSVISHSSASFAGPVLQSKSESFWLVEMSCGLRASWAVSGVAVLVQLEMDTSWDVGDQVERRLYGEAGGVSYMSTAVPAERQRWSSQNTLLKHYLT